MKVKCIKSDHSDGKLKLNAVYDVISETPNSYLLVGHPQPWSKTRFVPLRQVKCVRTDGTIPALVKDKVYHILTDRDGVYTLAEHRQDDTYNKERFADAYEGPPTLHSEQPIAKKEDDDVATQLAFFKKRTFGNECPCGSNRGVCPDHP